MQKYLMEGGVSEASLIVATTTKYRLCNSGMVSDLSLIPGGTITHIGCNEGKVSEESLVLGTNEKFQLTGRR